MMLPNIGKPPDGGFRAGLRGQAEDAGGLLARTLPFGVGTHREVLAEEEHDVLQHHLGIDATLGRLADLDGLVFAMHECRLENELLEEEHMLLRDRLYGLAPERTQRTTERHAKEQLGPFADGVSWRAKDTRAFPFLGAELGMRIDGACDVRDALMELDGTDGFHEVSLFLVAPE